MSSYTMIHESKNMVKIKLKPHKKLYFNKQKTDCGMSLVDTDITLMKVECFQLMPKS